MSAPGRLEQLRRRKELLFAQAELERQSLRLEAQAVAQKLHWVETGYRFSQNVKAAAAATSPWVDILVPWRRAPLLRGALLGIKLWRAFRRKT